MRNQGLPEHVDPRRRFKVSSYWHTWNRVLQYPTWYPTDQRHLQMIEFSVTTKNGDQEHEWADVAEIRIRKHNTPIESKDKFADTIPMSLYNIMGLRLGPELRDFMLYQNFDPLKEFDWVKYREVDNGGAPLSAIWTGKIPQRRIFK